MTVLNLDRSERRQFIDFLVDGINAGEIGCDRDECWDALVRRFGARYEFDESDLNSEFESVMDEAMANRLCGHVGRENLNWPDE